MATARRYRPAALMGLLGAALSLIPYLLAARLVPPGRVFSGFLLNPWDGYSYLAKMLQGFAGEWRFHLPYAAEAGAGSFLFLYYLFLGHLARTLNLTLLSTYHGARVLSAALMFALAAVFFEVVLERRSEKVIASLLTLFGAGLGWLGLPFGDLASDLLIPESIPFQTAYVNAHFPLALALELAGALLVLGQAGRLRWRMLAAALCGALLAVVLPFAALTVILVLAGWLGWEWLRGRSQTSGPGAGAPAGLGTTFALVIGAAPPLLYDAWLASAHPVLTAWMSQNQTPSPPLWQFALGFGPVLALAAAGAWLTEAHRDRTGRLMLLWLMLNGALLYAPFSLQRRFALGLFIPLAGLAGRGWSALQQRRPGWRALLPVALALSIPSNLIAVGAGLAGVAKGDPLLTLSLAEARAYAWAGGHLPEGALVLAAPLTGNRLPAYALVRVLYGHPFETPDAVASQLQVEELFRGDGAPGAGLESVRALGIDYVFWGPLERQLGAPAWLGALEPVYASGGVEIYRVREP